MWRRSWNLQTFDLLDLDMYHSATISIRGQCQSRLPLPHTAAGVFPSLLPVGFERVSRGPVIVSQHIMRKLRNLPSSAGACSR
jgi:hypothetical protein